MAGTDDAPMPGEGDDSGQDQAAYPGHASGHLDPALQDTVSSMQTGMGQAWTSVAANRVQDYLTTKAVAQQNEAAADELTNNLASAKQGFVGLVKTDPGAMDLALDLATHTVNGIVDQHQHLDEDTRAATSSSLIDHMHGEIAHAGIQRLAEIDQPAALKAIDQYGHLLGDGEADALKTYAQNQENFRVNDAQAVAAQQQRDAALAGYHSSSTYLHSLMGENGEFTAPQGFTASLMADPSIPNETRMAMAAGYQMLQANGDPHMSDPHVVADLIGRMASPDRPPQYEVMSHLGSNLTVNDAAFLNGLLGPKSPAERNDLSNLSGAINDARATLAHPANGPGGDMAFQRFTNWLIPTLQRGVPLPEALADNALQRFAPTREDAVAAARASMYPSLADLSRPGRDAINEGAGPIGEAILGAAAGGVGGAARVAAGAAKGILADEAGSGVNPFLRAARDLGDGWKKYDIVHPTEGNVMGSATIQLPENGVGDAYVANIRAGSNITGDPNSFGGRVVMGLIRQLRQENPGLTGIGGTRVSGARAGGNYGAGGGDFYMRFGQ